MNMRTNFRCLNLIQSPLWSKKKHHYENTPHRRLLLFFLPLVKLKLHYHYVITWFPAFTINKKRIVGTLQGRYFLVKAESEARGWVQMVNPLSGRDARPFSGVFWYWSFTTSVLGRWITPRLSPLSHDDIELPSVILHSYKTWFIIFKRLLWTILFFYT